jgi:hypothetical protein
MTQVAAPRGKVSASAGLQPHTHISFKFKKTKNLGKG